jgi:hypothetical protein
VKVLRREINKKRRHKRGLGGFCGLWEACRYEPENLLKLWMSIRYRPTSEPRVGRREGSGREKWRLMALTGSVRESFAVAVAGGHSVTRAAERLGIGRRTATRWLSDPAFAKRVSELRTAATQRALSVLSNSTTLAARRLRKLLNDPQATVRHKAAVSILEIQCKLNLALEIEERLAALESRQPIPPTLNRVHCN